MSGYEINIIAYLTRFLLPGVRACVRACVHACLLTYFTTNAFRKA